MNAILFGDTIMSPLIWLVVSALILVFSVAVMYLGLGFLASGFGVVRRHPWAALVLGLLGLWLWKGL